MFQEVIIEAMEATDLQTLQYLSALRVAISVCQTEDVQSMIRKFRKPAGKDGIFGFSDGQWKQLRGRVKRKLSQIGVPSLTIDKVLEYLWPISFQIYKWILCHFEDTGIDCSPIFYWTPRANIDYKKTAVILAKNEALDLKKRFRLACFYCMESKVRSLWDQMNLSERRSFYARNNLKKSYQNPIVLYWTYYIQEAPIDFWDSKALNHAQLFKYSVENGYLSATKYFLAEMKAQLKNRMVSNSFFIYFRTVLKTDCHVKDHTAIACFLMRKIRPDNTIIYLAGELSLVFLYFLEWPMQKHFLAVINSLRRYLRQEMYGELLKRIFEKYLGVFKDYDYKELFMEFWLQMPAKFKTFVNTSTSVGFKIFILFVKKHFGFVFDEKAFTLKAKFRAVVFQQEISEDETEKENVEFFKFLVRERVTTKIYFMDRWYYRQVANFLFQEFGQSFFDLPMGELMYLMDGILASPTQSLIQR